MPCQGIIKICNIKRTFFGRNNPFFCKEALATLVPKYIVTSIEVCVCVCVRALERMYVISMI